MIWRAALVREKPLPTDRGDSRRPTYQQFLRDATGLLQSCQLILEEASPIFYAENTLRLHVHQIHTDSWCEIFRSIICIPPFFEETADALGYIDNMVAYHPDDSSANAYQQWQQDRIVFDRFPNIDLSVFVADAFETNFYLICRALNPLLRSKNVTLTLLHETWSGGPMSKDGRAESIRACRMLKCKTLVIAGNEDLSSLKRQVVQRRLHPRVDLLPGYIKLYWIVRKLLSEDMIPIFFEAHYGLLRRLERSIVAFDSQATHVHLSELYRLVNLTAALPV